MTRALGWLLGLALAPLCGSAADLSPQDFAFGLQVLTTREAAGYRVALPLVVYRDTVRDDLGDVRLFNAQGEAVPYSLLQPQPPSPTHGAATALPVFPLRGTSRAVIDGVRLSIESGGSAVNVQTQGGGVNLAVNQYILDGRVLDAPVSALRLDWPDTASDFSGRAKVEVSDDLGSWQTLVTGAPIANLHANRQALIENRVTLGPTKTRFWRITWVGPAPTFELTSVLAEPADIPAETVHANLEASGVADATDADAYSFDLGAHPPVSRVNLVLPETNMVSGIELSSRRTPRDPWRFIARGNFYRIKAGDGEQHNAPIEIGIDRDRYWRARLSHGGGVPQLPLRLHVEWVPTEVTFLARGQGPFMLVYGSSAVLGAEADLSTLPAATEIGFATVGAPRSLGGPGRLDPRLAAFPWIRAVLWSVLILAVALLGWMALRLSKDTR